MDGELNTALLLWSDGGTRDRYPRCR